MPASADYLTKYLTAATTKDHASNPDFEDSSRPKKRRKKDKSANTPSSNLLIADDDDGLLLSNQRRRAQDDDDDSPMVYEGNVRSAEFRKKKSSAWTAVVDEDTQQQQQHAPTNSTANGRGSDDEEADRILAAAAHESDARKAEIDMEDAPAVVDTPNQDQNQSQNQDSAPKMSSGVKAGLQTAADTAALTRAEEAREDEERRRSRKKKARQKDDSADAEADPTQQTIYRDATGRRIDISLRRQELRLAELAKIAAEKKERENAMGEVQLEARHQAKEELENAKFLTLGRSAEDEELNERQREELRWDDPMAGYMAERQAEREQVEEARDPGRRRKGRDEDVGGSERVKKRVYLGAAPPNRYGIKPGWRWDGVDRGNGFEKDWFQARGKKSRMEDLSYQWQMDE